MIPTETKEIDGTVFRVKGLELRTERSMLVRLTKLLGPSLAALAAGGSSMTGEALKTALAGLDDAELDYLVETFRKVTDVRMVLANEKETWVPCVDSVFRNGASSQLKWLWFCLEHQFGGFLGSASGKLEEYLQALLSKAKASGLSSPRT